MKLFKQLLLVLMSVCATAPLASARVCASSPDDPYFIKTTEVRPGVLKLETCLTQAPTLCHPIGGRDTYTLEELNKLSGTQKNLVGASVVGDVVVGAAVGAACYGAGLGAAALSLLANGFASIPEWAGPVLAFGGAGAGAAAATLIDKLNPVSHYRKAKLLKAVESSNDVCVAYVPKKQTVLSAAHKLDKLLPSGPAFALDQEPSRIKKPFSPQAERASGADANPSTAATPLN